MDSSTAQQTEPSPAGKVRVLIQTVTHLVPGNDRGEQLRFLENKVCQLHWGRDFDRAQERIYAYHDHDDFGLKKVECFFIIDHRGHDHATEEVRAPVVFYKWTGESLVRMFGHLPPKILRELLKLPFTWHKAARREPDGTVVPELQRDVIALCLLLGNPILEHEIEFLREHPKHAEWLKARLHPELWKKIEPYCNLPRQRD